jgi:hypothetical protein
VVAKVTKRLMIVQLHVNFAGVGVNSVVSSVKNSVEVHDDHP